MIHKTQIFKNLFTSSFLTEITKLVFDYIQNLNENQILKVSHGIYYPVSKEVNDLLAQKLPLLPKETMNASFLKHSVPTGPHTDTNISDEDFMSNVNNFARTFIIPLRTQDTYTITFNQHMEKGTRGNDLYKYLNTLPDLTESISTHDKDLYFKNMIAGEWEKKLSIEVIFKWEAGDILVFDRHRVHTGDYHLGKIEKEGLVIWSNIN